MARQSDGVWVAKARRNASRSSAGRKGKRARKAAAAAAAAGRASERQGMAASKAASKSASEGVDAEIAGSREGEWRLLCKDGRRSEVADEEDATEEASSAGAVDGSEGR